MHVVTVPELQAVVSVHDRPCISIYIPTHRRPPGNAQDPIRFRNQLRRVEELLANQDASEVRALLEPLQALVGDRRFWEHRWEGLGVLRSRDFFRAFHMTRGVAELAVVAETFHTRPLFAEVRGDRPFFVLALSSNRVRLFAGSALGLEPVDVQSLPEDLRDVLGEADPQRYTGRHSAPSGGDASTVQHGHEDGNEKDGRLVKYFRAVDRALWQYLREDRAPLVLAAVKEHLPVYRSVSRYPYLLDQAVAGNADAMEPDELHTLAWPLIAADMQAECDRHLSRYGLASSRHRTTESLEEIAHAAVHGRVQTLLHADTAHLWGLIDAATGHLQLREHQQDASDAELVDELCEMTLIRGGQVQAVPADRMPGGAPVAGILRW